MRKLQLSLAIFLFFFAASAQAANIVPKAFGGFSPFGFSGLGAIPVAPPPAPAAPASSTTNTTQTAACLLNACGNNAPGFTSQQLATGANSLAGGSNNLVGAYAPSSLGQFGVFGMSSFRSTYQVFGMYNVQGNTQQPAFSGGLGSGQILASPGTAPEPGSIALFGAGLLALGWMRKRRHA